MGSSRKTCFTNEITMAKLMMDERTRKAKDNKLFCKRLAGATMSIATVLGVTAAILNIPCQSKSHCNFQSLYDTTYASCGSGSSQSYCKDCNSSYVNLDGYCDFSNRCLLHPYTDCCLGNSCYPLLHQTFYICEWIWDGNVKMMGFAFDDIENCPSDNQCKDHSEEALNCLIATLAFLGPGLLFCFGGFILTENCHRNMGPGLKPVWNPRQKLVYNVITQQHSYEAGYDYR